VTVDLRQAVADAAGRRCECRGECRGRGHLPRGARRPAGGPAPRCQHAELPDAPLHAVPRVAVPLHIAARLGAAGLAALCPGCADGVAKVHAAELAARPAPPSSPLFALGGAA
jgi:hypothetical protein